MFCLGSIGILQDQNKVEAISSIYSIKNNKLSCEQNSIDLKALFEKIKLTK